MNNNSQTQQQRDPHLRAAVVCREATSVARGVDFFVDHTTESITPASLSVFSSVSLEKPKEVVHRRHRGGCPRWTKESFFANTIRDGNDNCWIWAGSKARGTDRTDLLRGFTSLNGVFMQATKAAYVLEYGKLPPRGKQLNHRCNIALCVRPDHLYVGTHQENMADSVRMRSGTRRCDDKTRELKRRLSIKLWKYNNIRDIYHAGGFSMTDIARMFSLDLSLVYRIIMGERKITGRNATKADDLTE